MKKKAVIGLFTSGAVLAGLIAATAIPAMAEGDEPSIADESLTVNTVDIDIKPDSEENPINNNGKGVIPVAILGSAEFDVSQIDPATVQLKDEDGGILYIKTGEKSGKFMAHTEDVNNDGHLDLVVQIQDDEEIFEADDTEAFLTGELDDGTLIEGADYIWLVPNNG